MTNNNHDKQDKILKGICLSCSDEFQFRINGFVPKLCNACRSDLVFDFEAFCLDHPDLDEIDIDFDSEMNLDD